MITSTSSPELTAKRANRRYLRFAITSYAFILTVISGSILIGELYVKTVKGELEMFDFLIPLFLWTVGIVTLLIISLFVTSIRYMLRNHSRSRTHVFAFISAALTGLVMCTVTFCLVFIYSHSS